MNKYLIFSLLLLLQTGNSFGDCGCERKALMDVTYIESKTGLEKKVTLRGLWWAINYSDTPYEEKKIGKMSLEDQLTYRLTHHTNVSDTFYSVDKLFTIPVQTKSNGEITFPFLKIKNKIKTSDIQSVVKVSNLEVGCTAWGNYVPKEHVDIAKKSKPLKVKEGRPSSGGNYYTYKLGYELPDEVVNINFTYKYDGGCA